MLDKFTRAILDAQSQAIAHQIEANMIMLSPNLAYSVFATIKHGEHPMICGMNVVIANEKDLPSNVEFAIMYNDSMPKAADELQRLQDENKLLREQLERIKSIIASNQEEYYE